MRADNRPNEREKRMTTTALSGKQRRIIAACMFVYTTAYLNRLNLSAALHGIMEALTITATQGGLLQTAFAVAYAAGQIVNGAISNRVDPVRHVFIGILFSGVCNVLMGVCGQFAPLLCLCVLNGAFQSMLWIPVVRLIALNFPDQTSREKANLIISMTMMFGHLGAWALSGYIAGWIGWRYAFIAPAALVLPACAVAFLLFRRAAPQRNAPMPASVQIKTPRNRAAGQSLSLFLASGFILLLFGCVLFGFVRDGIVTWLPSILGGMSGGNSVTATSLSLIIPVVNAGGMFGAYLLQRRMRVRNRRMIAFLLLLGACLCAPLATCGGMLATALLTGCCCACLAGLAPILTALVPMEYDRENLIGLTAGLIDSLIYVGSALAGVCAGLLYEHAGANALFACFAAAALAASAAAWFSGRLYDSYQKKAVTAPSAASPRQ